MLIDLVLGVGELAISDHRSSQPTLDELLRVAGDAHVGGLMSGKAGILHLHVGDGERGPRAGPRGARRGARSRPPVFNPTHVNRRRALFEEALALAERGCTIDITAFPVAEDEDALERRGRRWCATWTAGLPPERVTVSSDGGGCLPVFDADGRVVDDGRGPPGRAHGETLRELLACGQPLERVLPPFTGESGAAAAAHPEGAPAVGADADLVVLDERGGGGGGDGAGAVARARGPGGGAGDVRVVRTRCHPERSEGAPCPDMVPFAALRVTAEALRATLR